MSNFEKIDIVNSLSYKFTDMGDFAKKLIEYLDRRDKQVDWNELEIEHRKAFTKEISFFDRGIYSNADFKSNNFKSTVNIYITMDRDSKNRIINFLLRDNLHDICSTMTVEKLNFFTTPGAPIPNTYTVVDFMIIFNFYHEYVNKISELKR